MNAPLKRNAGLAFSALLASSGTLVCCVLPAVMVALGAGATLAGLVSAVPQLVWLSEHKILVFGTAATVLALSGFAIWRSRSAPCPIEPEAARACLRLRRWTTALYSLALLAFVAGATFAFVIPAFAVESPADRQAEVRERGAEVMTFSLGATLHVFQKTNTGGVQKVRARDGHGEQVPMIREHLKSIAQAFGTRDFSGPTHVHGTGMPGLAGLKNAPKDDLEVTYRDIDNGAEVTYRGKSEATITAVHRWFDAQLADHGADASSK